MILTERVQHLFKSWFGERCKNYDFRPLTFIFHYHKMNNTIQQPQGRDSSPMGAEGANPFPAGTGETLRQKDSALKPLLESPGNGHRWGKRSSVVTALVVYYKKRNLSGQFTEGARLNSCALFVFLIHEFAPIFANQKILVTISED